MEILQTPYGNFNFYINYLNSSEENFFHISFVDKSNKTYSIVMTKSGEEWIILNPHSLPIWITALHRQFNSMITRETGSEAA
jgi:hypothetical protein